jgi:hypothetical protein
VVMAGPAAVTATADRIHYPAWSLSPLVDLLIRSALVDEHGRVYEAPQLPCTDRPEWWDEDARRADQRTAIALCRTDCPALAACEDRRVQLSGTVGGVWAGVVMRRGT